MFNIYEDLSPFCQSMEKHRLMAYLISRLRGIKSPTTPAVYEALVDSVTEQQISLKAAHSIENRLIRAVGIPLTLDGCTFYCYPTPDILQKQRTPRFVRAV